MKILIILSLILSSLSGFSKDGYILNMDISSKGKPMTTSEVIVIKGEKATLTKSFENKTTEISILASEGEIQGIKGILLDMSVVEIINGKRKVTATPQVLVNEGKEATLETASLLNEDKFKLKIKAKRMTI